MTNEILIERDEYGFLRHRAMQLLDEGLEAEARKLLTVIDAEQVRRIVAELQKSESHRACRGS